MIIEDTHIDEGPLFEGAKESLDEAYAQRVIEDVLDAYRQYNLIPIGGSLYRAGMYGEEYACAVGALVYSPSPEWRGHAMPLKKTRAQIATDVIAERYGWTTMELGSFIGGFDSEMLEVAGDRGLFSMFDLGVAVAKRVKEEIGECSTASIA